MNVLGKWVWFCVRQLNDWWRRARCVYIEETQHFLSLCRDGRVLGVLEVSRSIGDGQYKRCGVISVPDIKRCQLTHNDR